MEFRNPQFNARGGIDCEVNHPVLGWIPFTATDADTESAGRDLHSQIIAAGGIADYAPPSIEETLAVARSSAVLTRADFCSALHANGILPAAEAVLAAKGDWPATFAPFTEAMTEADAADVQIRWAGAVKIHYDDILLQQIALAHASGDPIGATTALDAIFGIGGAE